MMNKPLFQIFLPCLITTIVISACNQSKTNSNSPQPIAPTDPRSELIGYWKLENPNSLTESEKKAGVAHALRFASRVVNESTIFTLDYCNDLVIARSSYELSENFIKTPFSASGIPWHESVPVYKPEITFKSNNQLQLDRVYNYEKFNPTTELKALGDQSTADLCALK